MRRIIVTLAIAALTGASAIAAPVENWVGAWSHTPTAYNTTLTVPPPDRNGVVGPPRPGAYAALPPYKDVTVRQVVRLAAGAQRVRLRFSNEFSNTALKLGPVHVALAGENGAITPGSDHVITFNGKPDALIPPGAPLLSDPIDWTLPALSRLSVSVYYPQDAIPPAHNLYALKAFALSGDRTATVDLTGATNARTGNHLAAVEIVSPAARQTIVAFGDSITEGVASTSGAFLGWPDVLADRLAADPAARAWSVSNAGIGSNRLLHDTPSVNGLARFDRDALAVPGVAAVIVMLGINDIQYSHRNPDEAVSAEEIIGAMKQLATRARAHHLKIYGATITPFKGSGDFTPEGEAMRQTVNQWIRSPGAFDGVADFDAVLRDAADPALLAAGFDSGGHLHPNDAGYAAMGKAIDLRWFGAKRAN